MESNDTTSFTLSISERGQIWQWLLQPLQASWTLIAFTAFAAVLLPAVTTGVYRLYFHPLRNVPGPKLAALTNFYAFYWNWIRDEGYSKRFGALHKYYSKIRHSNQLRVPRILKHIRFSHYSHWSELCAHEPARVLRCVRKQPRF